MAARCGKQIGLDADGVKARVGGEFRGDPRVAGGGRVDAGEVPADLTPWGTPVWRRMTIVSPA
jgi:hypothetical protein